MIESRDIAETLGRLDFGDIQNLLDFMIQLEGWICLTPERECILKKFGENSFSSSHTDSPALTEDENYGRWLIGQCLAGIDYSGSPPETVHELAVIYREKKALLSL